jgi:outer membrane protein OmpA-like peptidoglycan-associated protein
VADPATPEPGPLENGGRSVSEFAALRRILVGPEQSRLDELANEIREKQLTAADLAEHLPEAILLRAKRDRQIGRALAPTVETALRESIRRNPREIATAIFPVLGPAIRKAIAETMASLVRSINSAVEHSFSPRGIRWRLESWRTGVPYAQVVISHALVYRVEQAFLIHADTGLLLSHATAPEMQVPDADLISGMMTAIQDFVRDSFRPGEGATLRTFSVGDHTVQVEAGPLALLALVVRGQAPDAVLRKQQDVLETVHVQFASVLMEFSGDTAPFEPARALLEECLETVVDTASRRSGRLFQMWAIPVAVALVALLLIVARSRARFDRGVAAVDAEPGLVVIDSRQRWGRWEISGLADPGARSPSVVLAGAGLTPRALDGRWEPYLSLDSAVVVSRARRALAMSSSAVLSLAGDTLNVSGDVPLESIQLSAERPLSGVNRVVFDSARVILPPALDSIRNAITSDRVLFVAGSADVPGDASGRIREAARRFQLLDDSISASGGDLILTLVGRTDPTGSDETNQALAQWRVDRVAAIFAAAGVRTQRLRGEALATSRPLTSADREEQARINRSVSFEVTVSPKSVGPRGR